ncbi:hypothetical protein [Microbacterium sp. SS28]|uniref:hypothetical protein n=1 Tax=Microbacterium sp. SS28 TaxID=2919948 RepID=UPI001FAAE129|nr:hypothetical protein [Microbacterium sp. SS28]
MAGVWAIQSASLTPDASYKGIVPLTVQFDLGAGIPSAVSVSLGRTSRPMTRIGGTNIWQAAPWDTTRRLRDTSTLSPSNYCAWVQVHATYSGAPQSTQPFPVYTANYDYGGLADRSWNPQIEWAADYSSMSAWLASFTGTIFGRSYASLVNDPVRGKSRKAIKVTLPDSARFDSDQPTNSPRFQAQQPTASPWRGVTEGDTFYVGFAVYVPKTNSSAAGSGGFPTVRVSDPEKTNKHIAIFQMFGPQASEPTSYPAGRGAITIIDANRNSEAEAPDRFHIDANQLNGGDPGFLVDFGYNRGAWTDIVLGIKMSADIQRGWIEVYLNQGEHSSVQPVRLFGGKTRLPRVTAWPSWSKPAVPATYVGGELVTGGSYSHRTDMQIYRSPTAYDEVTLLHTGHSVGPTPESVDPRSYA